jgi:lipopolysaccharide/colanic/teichoic acid biosynthesis glycosyltransferase
MSINPDMCRRLLDLMLALGGLLVLSPVFVVLAILVKLDSPGPALYQGQRIGKGGQPFYLYKFRTMVVGADQQGPRVTGADDERVTRVGRLLRRWKLDELPQLLNVVKGDMSLVGPRPEDPTYVQHYTSEQQKLLLVRPGITSPASLKYRSEESLLTQRGAESVYMTTILPDKLAIELAYLERRTLWSDICIVAKTIQTILSSLIKGEV